ncbi:cupin domain-containing protein [uncultured Bosea sp.]|uniref:cupin domain-containing protein n=1 Tax=uncultured Bosea sp. TaxID=211457 RepID=UPI0025EF1670|nr:cupin domain-containing protein [uncultured Bosea sp.]
MALKFMMAAAAATMMRQIAVVAPVTPAPLVAHRVDDLEMEMEPAPIEPSWIIAGQPEARVALHSRSGDDAASTAIWDCTAGAFRWYFDWDETVVILEGAVHVTAQDGSERLLRAGDIGTFAGGTWATWRVDTYVRKIAFCRKRFPAPVAMAYRLRNLLRGSSGSSGSLAA